MIIYIFSAPPTSNENGIDAKLDAGTQLSIEYSLGRKRKIAGDADDSDEDDQTVVPPAHDIYRARQQKKVR